MTSWRSRWRSSPGSFTNQWQLLFLKAANSKWVETENVCFSHKNTHHNSLKLLTKTATQSVRTCGASGSPKLQKEQVRVSVDPRNANRMDPGVATGAQIRVFVLGTDQTHGWLIRRWNASSCGSIDEALCWMLTWRHTRFRNLELANQASLRDLCTTISDPHKKAQLGELFTNKCTPVGASSDTAGKPRQ